MHDASRYDCLLFIQHIDTVIATNMNEKNTYPI
jgi:hypothetical protein